MIFKKKRVNLEEQDDIEDPETYRGETDLRYSHELLVMEQIRRTQKALNQEMKKGWEERKVDKFDNTMSIKTYPDTRKEVGECIETLKNIMLGFISRFPEVLKKINDYYKEVEDLEQHFVDLEEEEWNKIPAHIQRAGSNWIDRWQHVSKTLNYDHLFGEKYLQQSVSIHRKIFEEIIQLLHRLGYFKGEII